MEITGAGAASAQVSSSMGLLRKALDVAANQSAALLECLDPAVGQQLDVQA
ncbi:MAG: putative motility protein [Actinobacteria bacterium]|nr:putative motility protein [Actinomycetota bacterium]MCG2797262.1 putative motility protein [Cellulomonas sp.]